MRPDDTLDRVIRACEAQRNAAMLGGQVDDVLHLFHPDLTYIHASGVMDDLRSYLSKCRSGEVIYHALKHDIDTVTRMGELAIAVGELTATVTSGGVRKQLHNRTLTAWHKTNDQWQLRIYQATPLKPAGGLEAAHDAQPEGAIL